MKISPVMMDLVNFVDKEIILGKIVNYLRNSFQGLKPASRCCIEKVYQSLNQNIAVIDLNDDFVIY